MHLNLKFLQRYINILHRSYIIYKTYIYYIYILYIYTRPLLYSIPFFRAVNGVLLSIGIFLMA